MRAILVTANLFVGAGCAILAINAIGSDDIKTGAARLFIVALFGGIAAVAVVTSWWLEERGPQ